MLGFGLNLGDGRLLVVLILLLLFPLAKPFRFILLGVLLDGKLAGLIRCWDRSEGV